MQSEKEISPCRFCFQPLRGNLFRAPSFSFSDCTIRLIKFQKNVFPRRSGVELLMVPSMTVSIEGFWYERLEQYLNFSRAEEIFMRQFSQFFKVNSSFTLKKNRYSSVFKHLFSWCQINGVDSEWRSNISMILWRRKENFQFRKCRKEENCECHMQWTDWTDEHETFQRNQIGKCLEFRTILAIYFR